MEVANYCVSAMLVAGRSMRAVAAATGHSKRRLHRHAALFKEGGEQAPVPKRRGPKVAPNQTSPEQILAHRDPRQRDGLARQLVQGASAETDRLHHVLSG